MHEESVDVDVVVVGAGLSGIGAAVHLKKKCVNRSFVILEGRKKLGGTWDLFRYPGIRSDSDMHTLGYNFKPWRASKSIADGPAILQYIQETVREYQLEGCIRYEHRVLGAEWLSERGVWRLTVSRGATAKEAELTCRVLYMCSGYYSYKEGYTPEFPGRENFRGDIIHPQAWPDNFDYGAKRIVVIGSGATAITLIPSLARKAAHVCMLQRSPTYVIAWPDSDRLANLLNRFLPARLAYAITRMKNIALQQYLYGFTQKYPERAKRRLLERARRHLGEDIDIETHFNPAYSPWSQRLCLAPNGDFFQTLKAGEASVVTGHIRRFTHSGIELEDGRSLSCNMIVTATGLKLEFLGGVEIRVDGQPVDLSKHWSYKGVAYSDIPNLFSCFGYVNASWTLRADLVSEYVCRILNHMEASGKNQCCARLRPKDRSMAPRPWIDGFTPGYFERGQDLFPNQGDVEPWLNPQHYQKNKVMFQQADLEDGVLEFAKTADQDLSTKRIFMG